MTSLFYEILLPGKQWGAEKVHVSGYTQSQEFPVKTVIYGFSLYVERSLQ